MHQVAALSVACLWHCMQSVWARDTSHYVLKYIAECEMPKHKAPTVWQVRPLGPDPSDPGSRPGRGTFIVRLSCVWHDFPCAWIWMWSCWPSPGSPGAGVVCQSTVRPSLPYAWILSFVLSSPLPCARVMSLLSGPAFACAGVVLAAPPYIPGTNAYSQKQNSTTEGFGACGTTDLEHSISGLVVEYIVAIDVTRVRFPADACLLLS